MGGGFKKLIITVLAQPTCLFLRVSMVAVMQHAYLTHRAYTSGRKERRMMKKIHLERCFSINMIELHQLHCQTLKTCKTVKFFTDQKKEKN